MNFRIYFAFPAGEGGLYCLLNRLASWIWTRAQTALCCAAPGHLAECFVCADILCKVQRNVAKHRQKPAQFRIQR